MGRENFAVAAPAFVMAGGSGIFAAFLVVFTIVIVYSLYTRRGSMINPRPYNKVYIGAPGARGPGSVSGRDERERLANWSRGTR